MLTVAQGFGIPAADLPHIFERGYRATNVASVADGLGLGLAGAKETVTELQGTIDVKVTNASAPTVSMRVPFGVPPVSTGGAWIG